MVKNKIFLLLLIVATISLSGCYDLKEINETDYVIALGIDKSQNQFSYSFQFSSPLPLASQKSESGEESETESAKGSEESKPKILTIQAEDFYIAKNTAENMLSKKVDLSHLKLIVFSSKISPDALEEHSQLFLHEREVRPNTAVSVSTDSPEAFLEGATPNAETNPSRHFEMMSLGTNNPYAPHKRLHDFVDDISVKGRDTILPIAMNSNKRNLISDENTDKNWVPAKDTAINQEHSLLYGLAIFKNGQLSDAMGGDSAMLYNIITREIKSCVITIKSKYNKDETLSFRVMVPEKGSFDVSPPENRITLSQELRLQYMGAILPEGFGSSEELLAYAQSVLTSRLKAFLLDILRSKEADILDIRSYTRGQFLTACDWENFDWDSFSEKAQINVKLNFS